MIRILTGNLFESSAQTFVNTVNCVGVMGKGIALEFKERFPEMYEDYQARCGRGEVKLGEPYLFKRLLPPWILNFPTKDHWRSVSRLSDIVRGLKHLEAHYRQWGIESLAVPPLGCGLGGLEWRIVGPTLYRYLSPLDIPVDLYAPHGTPQSQLDAAFLGAPSDAGPSANGRSPTSRIPEGSVALIEVLRRIHREPYHWPIGRTAFQKIAYFATEIGLPTGLHFQRGSYGPFSSQLKPLVTKLVNNGLIYERRLGKMFSLEPGATAADAGKEFEAALDSWSADIERIVNLFLRMNTHQAEIAATVDFASREVAQRSTDKPTEADVVDEVMRWKQKRRPPLNREEVASTARRLNLLGWIDLRVSNDLPVETEADLDV